MKELDLASIVVDLFRTQNFTIDTSSADSRKHGPDFIVNSGQARAAVEVKSYSSRHVQPSTILKAAQALENVRVEQTLDRGILAMNANADDGARSLLKQFPSITLYDYENLAFLLTDKPDLMIRQQVK